MSKLLARRILLGLFAAGLGLSALQPVAAQTVDEIKKRGSIRIGVLSELPPWGFLDASGNLAGYDVDVGNLVAKKLGVRADFTGMTVAARIAQLMTGKVDVLLATMGMYPERAKAVQFTEPYAGLKIILLAKKSQRIEKLDDAAKLRIGVTRGAAQDIAITKGLPPGSDIRRFDDDSAVIQALVTGQVEAAGANTTYILNINKVMPNNDFEQKLVFNDQWMGAAIKPGNKDLNVWLNDFIEEIKANGQLQAISVKWVGLPLPVFPASLPDIPYTVQ